MIKTRDKAMLFDLENDKGEQKNLIHQNNGLYEKQYKKQRSQYQQWNDELQDPAFPRLGSWDYSNQNTSQNKNNKKTKIK